METQNKQITIIDQVKDIETRSGVAFEIDITEVVSLAKRAATITDVNDPNFASVKKEMQTTRKYVKDYFMDARSEFNRLAKGVIEVEKIVLAEFTPEENRLIAMHKAEQERLLREARLEALPAKRDRITWAVIEFTDEEILTMDDATFELEFAKRVSEKAEADRIAAEAALAKEREALEAEKAELARKQAEADRIEAARVEERQRAEEVLRLAQEKAERDAKEAEEKRNAEDEERRLEAERKEREAEEVRIAKEKAEAKEKEKREADAKWQSFLKDNNYNEETDILRPMDLDGTTGIYRLVAEFKN